MNFGFYPTLHYQPCTATSFNFQKEVENKFTKVNDQNFNLEIASGTIEMKDNKVIVLAD